LQRTNRQKRNPDYAQGFIAGAFWITHIPEAGWSADVVGGGENGGGSIAKTGVPERFLPLSMPGSRVLPQPETDQREQNDC
jgi:hypothetical protein